MSNAYVSDTIKKEYRPRLQSLADDLKRRRDKDFFWPTGTQVYCGLQGSGKTISAVNHLLQLKKTYPKAIIVSNLDLKYYKPLRFDTKSELKNIVENIKPDTEYILYDNIDQLAQVLVHVNNGFKGVIYFVDEIHTYFNALDSKNIPMFVFTEISQQRKQRKVIIGTSQLFLRLAKPFREQCDNVIVCKTIGGVFTMQTCYDGMSLEQDYQGKMYGTVKKRGWFWHNRKVRNAFDTYQKVVSSAEQYEPMQRLEIQQKGKKLKIISK